MLNDPIQTVVRYITARITAIRQTADAEAGSTTIETVIIAAAMAVVAIAAMAAIAAAVDIKVASIQL